MKKNISKAILPLVLLFSFGANASISANAAEGANASTEMAINVKSGGLTVSSDKNLDFGSIALNKESSLDNKVTVVNYTGTNSVSLTGAMKEVMPEGIQMRSESDGWLSGEPGSQRRLKGLSNTGQIDGITVYDFSWILSAGSTYQGKLGPYSNEIIITASPEL